MPLKPVSRLSLKVGHSRCHDRFRTAMNQPTLFIYSIYCSSSFTPFIYSIYLLHLLFFIYSIYVLHLLFFIYSIYLVNLLFFIYSVLHLLSPFIVLCLLHLVASFTPFFAIQDFCSLKFRGCLDSPHACDASGFVI